MRVARSQVRFQNVFTSKSELKKSSAVSSSLLKYIIYCTLLINNFNNFNYGLRVIKT
jgi:hypothetical protein